MNSENTTERITASELEQRDDDVLELTADDVENQVASVKFDRFAKRHHAARHVIVQLLGPDVPADWRNPRITNVKDATLVFLHAQRFIHCGHAEKVRICFGSYEETTAD